MASSAKGERRWASTTKRGGMTVLGKVAVPKPINLPSQRLENHGLDPNVEIVPKGSLSWGSRPSSSGSNAWGSSSVLSPRAEDGRPSSGGGTRPSTAGSERTLDSTSNVWTSTSRPSSASGMLASNNASLVALRPRSAETRPGSSQKSRFAESPAEGAAAWGASGAADKLGISASRSDGFSLSSGDFPTLGSEKDSGKDTEPSDHCSHGRPGSAFGAPSAPTKKMEVAHGDDLSRSTDVSQSTMADSWRNDGPESFEDGPHPGIERWHGDPYSHPNPNIPPHPYETWRGGAPVNPAGGIWFRGPPGTPYGAPAMTGPGGFPMEPFHYYRPQVPAPGLVNSQTVPPHNAGPRGPNSKNGDMCRPIMEPYMRPGMPIRPGFYPGYYGPPMGFCSPNERDFPFMGMPAGPHYNRYPNQNAPESANSNNRSSELRTLEPFESDPSHDSRRYCNANAPFKQNKNWDKNADEDQSDQKVKATAHPRGGGYVPNSSSQENFWSEDHEKNEQMNNGNRPLRSEETSDLLEENNDSTDQTCAKLHGSASSGGSAIVNPVVGNVAMQRDQRLIQKIEGLNQKARVSDARYDIRRDEAYSREVVGSMSGHPINESNAGVHLERHYPSGILVPVPRDMTVPTEEKGFCSAMSGTTTISRRPSHNVQGRGDHGGKPRSIGQEADGWRKQSAGTDYPGVVSAERNPNMHGIEHSLAMQTTEMSRTDGEGKDVSKLCVSEPSDSQRAKMREIAKQRAMQLQKEEEERIREQKAKAQAKLEELNRRSANQGKEASRDGTDIASSHAIVQKHEEPNVKIELQFGSNQSVDMTSILVHGNRPSKASTGLESNPSSGVDERGPQDRPVLIKKQLLPANEDARISDAGSSAPVSEIPRQKRQGYKQKHNVHAGNNLSEKPVVDANENSSSIATNPKEVDVKGVASSFESTLPADHPKVDSSVLPKRKNNRVAKSKHKADESFSASSTSLQKEPDVSESVPERMKREPIVSKPEPLGVQQAVDSKDSGQSLEIHPSMSRDDGQYTRGSNSGKSQHARKVPKNPQGRPAEKSYSNDAVWAPVKSHNGTEVREVNEQKTEQGAVPSTRSDNAVPGSSKSKRAEMERYVPKAAIKEPSQVNIQQSASPSTDHLVHDDSSGIKGKVMSQAIERSGRPVEHRHTGTKPKQAQTHGSWRQRNSTDSGFIQVSGDRSSSMMDPTKNTETSDELQLAQKPKELPKGPATRPVAPLVSKEPSKQDEQRVKQQTMPIDVSDVAVDGWYVVDEPVPSGALPGVKDHGTSGRGKRNSHKGSKGSGNPQNFDRKNHNSHQADANYYSEAPPPDRPTSSKGKNAAHWQPKTQTHVANQQGNMAQGWQTATLEGEKVSKREASDSGSSQVKQHNNRDIARSMGQTQVYSPPESKDASGMQNMGGLDTGAERKAAPPKDRAYPSKDGKFEKESAPVGHTDRSTNEQRPSSGHHRNGNHDGRFNRSNEPHGDRSFNSHDNRKNYAPVNREKQRQNSRYEYQPVGPYNTNNRGNNSDDQFESQHAGPRTRGRGRGQFVDSRRGGSGFYGHQRGHNRTDGGYE